MKEDIKILTDYMLELNADIQRAEEWTNTGADEEMYFALKNVLDKLEELQKENEELKEYIAIAPNLDEMTATKYRNIQQDAYIQGRAEEQQKAEQIIYENYIHKQKIKDKIAEIEADKLNYGEDDWYLESELKGYAIDKLKELLKEKKINVYYRTRKGIYFKFR